MKNEYGDCMKYIVLLFVLGLVGCDVDGAKVHGAVNACKDHGGVTELVAGGMGGYSARCQDGTYFRNVGRGKVN